MSYTVYHLDSERGWRGGERQLLYLAAWLRSQGCENIVACRSGSPLEREARHLGLDALRLPFLSEWDPLSAALLRSHAARSRRPAILHAHTAHAAGAAFLASFGRGPAWVAHRRVDFRLSGSWSARLKYGRAAAVIAISRAVQDILVQDGVPSSRIRVIPDSIPLGPEEAAVAGLDAPLASPSAEERRGLRNHWAGIWKIPADATWIGNLAALVPHKDPATLLRAFAELRRARPEVYCLFIGDGPLLNEMRALARSLGVEDSVRFPGWQPNAWDCLKTFDLYVQSSWGEGMGSVLLEAMACGVPIVATTAGGIPEIIEDGRNGLLTPPRDFRAMAERIRTALGDPAFARHLAEEGTRSLSGYSLARCGRAVLEVYDAALRLGPGRAAPSRDADKSPVPASSGGDRA